MKENFSSSRIFTYPNVGSFKQRGGLKQRYQALERINRKFGTDDFQLVEMPADFVKNEKEERKTGLKVGAMLNPKTVRYLYSYDGLEKHINYILHTEPVSNKKGEKGNVTPKLEWYNYDWIDKFIKHVFSIINFLEITPYALEIHPGKFQRGKNNIEIFSQGIERLHKEYEERYGEETLIFIENRTGQYIQDGTDIKDFWELFKDEYPDLVNKTGIILDVQQLYTVTRDKFKTEFAKIPKDSLYGVHVHERHRTPKYKYVPKESWKQVSDKLKSIDSTERPFHILPEVLNTKNAEETYDFCKRDLKF